MHDDDDEPELPADLRALELLLLLLLFEVCAASACAISAATSAKRAPHWGHTSLSEDALCATPFGCADSTCAISAATFGK